jgi:hypothetical protein
MSQPRGKKISVNSTAQEENFLSSSPGGYGQ